MVLECGIERALNVVTVPAAGIFHKACALRKESGIYAQNLRNYSDLSKVACEHRTSRAI
jgi:hypothetical protein